MPGPMPFSPLELCDPALKNRVVTAPMHQYSGDESPLAIMPSMYGYWLAKREGAAKGYTPSAYRWENAAR